MSRPVGAAVLTIVGGFFIMLGGIGVALIGAIFAIFGVWSAFFLLGIGVGFLTILMGVLMLVVPRGHAAWGALTLIFAFVSIPFALAGLLLGFVLALVGGILAIAWKPLVDRVITVQARTVPPSSPP